MRLLLLSPYAIWPPRHGTGARIFNLARALAKRHQVTVVAFDDPSRFARDTPPFPFESIGLPWRLIRPGRARRWLSRFGRLDRTAASAANLAKLLSVIASRRIEVVVAQDLRLATLLPVLRNMPLVWVADGVASELRRPSPESDSSLYRRLQSQIEYLWWRRLETWTWRQANVLVAVSEEEAALLRARMGPRKRILVAPNGVDVAFFSEVRHTGTNRRALFVGSRWWPNAEALNFFAAAVLPRIRHEMPDFRLVVAGEVCTSRELRLEPSDGIDLVGFLEDLRPCLAASGVFVAPILSGHGTRIKILEALAAGLPVVSTRKGAEGLNLRDGSEILLADEPEQFAEAVFRVLSDAALAARLTSAARARVLAEYDWSRAAEQLEKAIALVCALGHRSG